MASMMETCRDLSCHLILALLCISFLRLITFAAADASCYVSKDKILLNTGSSESTSFNGRNWTGDVGSKFLPSSYDQRTSTASIASERSVPRVPYLTARIFHSPFTYSLSITPGLKFIRLYFYSAPYLGLHPSKASFSVISGHFTLLDNFSPSVTADALKSAYFTEDYYVKVKEQKLNVTFIPSSAVSKAFAFVNGIEISSMPSNMYVTSKNATLPLIGQHAPFFLHDETAFKVIYRVSAGDDLRFVFGPEHGTIVETTFRIHYGYNCSEYIAEAIEYSTARTMGSNDAMNVKYNLTWTFPVDSGFNYLVRLHFCEISSEVTEVNQRVFKVYINNQTAENSLDLVALTGASLIATYKDYVVMVLEGNENKQDLWLALHPYTESRPKYADAILNGIEIIKLSDRNNNLAAHIQIDNEKKIEKAPKHIMIGGVLGGLVELFFVCLISYGLWKRVKLVTPRVYRSRTVNHLNANVLSITSLVPCRQFSLEEVEAATNNFNEALVIGSGGFGKVYKGFIDGGTTKVAVKRGNPKSHQGVREFQNEIELLSKFRHMHLVSLIGYCQEGGVMILVYEYMAGGTLRDHLYKSQKPPLSWKQRLNICIGAARGLHHLHTGAKFSIIHRDVKTSNILLDHEWVAKVSDFGLSRIGPTTASRTHVSTEVKGTFGYLDPEYYRHRKLTEKSDVYSFGVVLFEVLSGRPAVKPAVTAEDEEDERVSLADWALHCHQTGTFDLMIDPHLRGQIATESLMVFAEMAVKCLAGKGVERPSMSDVLGNLEQALQLQETADAKE